MDDQQLAYSSLEYMGELFHVRLSCPHGQEGIAQSECLFFKVGGNTTVAERKDKFNQNDILLIIQTHQFQQNLTVLYQEHFLTTQQIALLNQQHSAQLK